MRVQIRILYGCPWPVAFRQSPVKTEGRRIRLQLYDDHRSVSMSTRIRVTILATLLILILTASQDLRAQGRGGGAHSGGARSGGAMVGRSAPTSTFAGRPGTQFAGRPVAPFV